MNNFSNFKTLFSNTRSRVVLIVTFLFLVFAIIIGIGLFSRDETKGDAKIARAPGGIQSVVGGFDKPVSPQYAKLLEEKNKEEAQRAFQTNGSAVPTIINPENLGNVTPQNNVCTPQAGQNQNMIQTTGNPPMGTVCSDGTVRNTDGKIIGRTGLIAPGGLVYDKNGKILGTVGPDGKVRNSDGNVIGALGADGTVRDANGNVIGTTTGGSQEGVVGKSVYDGNGKLLGYVGADGQVRDASGKVLGSVGPDGQVRDANGAVIGKVATGPKAGSSVYDSDGHLVGTVGADGKVRDALGKVLGTVGSDGQVRDASGKVIGKAVSREAQGIKTGSLVFDRNGHVIGTVGADGKVRDNNGNIVGAVDPDGTVHDNLGNLIGSAKGPSPGTAVYDPQGRFLGTVGADGKVRAADGSVVGSVGSDGVVRDASGRPIGRTSYIAPGSAVYGSDGRLIGSVGPDGQLVPATIGPGGNAVGGVATPQEQAMQRQQKMLDQQKSHQMVLQLQAAMSGQMSQLISSWSPPTQQVVTGDFAKKGALAAAGEGAGGSGVGSSASGGHGPAFVKAGTIMFAVLDTAVNSDEPGPIMATISEGKLKGAKLLGTMTLQGQKAMLTFNTISMPGASSSSAINTVAIDPGTARTALSSDTDNHYLLRYGTLFASSFMSGYAQALSQSGAQTTITVNGIVHQIPTFDSQQKIMMALGNVGQQYSSSLGNVINTPPTVKIYAGTGLGILFLSDMAAPAGVAAATPQS